MARPRVFESARARAAKRAAGSDRRRKLRQDALNLPNMLTYARVLMIPAVLLLIDRGTKRDGAIAAIVYAVASLTDLFDGLLARKLNIESVIGKFLDPLADKLMVMAALVWMAKLGRIPAWAVVVSLGRELTITGLRSIASTEGLVIAAKDSGKQKTALQMIGLLCMIIGYPYPLKMLGMDLGVVDLLLVGRALVYASIFMSVWSALQYFVYFGRALDSREDGDAQKS
ncbi:MAG: CDP-diacylglycerol--glycerol-3-phosphate 3-phosphatidyltransferase [Polyangiales bacterium]